jgi:small subunit ribosomal protein S20
LPVSKAAERELRVARKRTERNKAMRTLSKSSVKKAEKLLFSGDVASARAEVVNAVSTLDKAVNKGIMHANKAARTKSRLMKKLNKAAEITGESKKEEQPAS